MKGCREAAICKRNKCLVRLILQHWDIALELYGNEEKM